MRRGELVVFARAPRIGAVKSRLARTIGPVAAWRAYREMTDRVLRRIATDPRWRAWLAVTPDRFAKRGRFWTPPVARMAQGHGDLGARMASALAAFPHRPVVVIGSDIPAIGRDHIARAFAALRHADYVFGPASDGGYWLVGAAPGAPVRHLFDGVRWSGPHALADTLANIGPPRRHVLLQTLEDIDDAAALARWRAEKKGSSPDSGQGGTDDRPHSTRG